jgi:hypothetical protein
MSVRTFHYLICQNKLGNYLHTFTETWERFCSKIHLLFLYNNYVDNVRL